MFNRFELNPGDKIWYEAGFPDIRPGVIKERRVIYRYREAQVEYKLAFWPSRGWYRYGSWLPAQFVIGLQEKGII